MKYISPLNSRHNIFSGTPFGDLENQINALFGTLPSSCEVSQGARAETSSVLVDWYESEDGYHARIDLPGVKPADVDLEVKDGAVSFKAKRVYSGAKEGDDREVNFSKSIVLPDGVDVERISASHEDGVLEIDFPKAEKVKPRKIDVQFNN